MQKDVTRIAGVVTALVRAFTAVIAAIARVITRIEHGASFRSAGLNVGSVKAPRPVRRGAIQRSPWRVGRRPQRVTGVVCVTPGSVPVGQPRARLSNSSRAGVAARPIAGAAVSARPALIAYTRPVPQ